MIVKRILFLMFAVAFITNFLSAQTAQNSITEQDSVFSKSFFNNFYLKVELGSQALFSEDADKLDFKERLTPSYALEFGKWLCPVFALGIKAQGGTLNGYSTTEGVYLTVNDESNIIEDPVRNEVTINPDGSYRHFIRYTNISFNIYMNGVNLFGNKEGGFFELIPSLGIGNMHVSDYKGIPAKNTLSANCGLEGSFRIAPKLCLNIGANVVFFDNEFESRIAGDKTYEYYISANLGLVYYLKHRGFVRAKKKN